MTDVPSRPFGPTIENALSAAPPLPDLVHALGPAAERGRAVREYIDEARKHARSVHDSGGSGARVVETWTRLVDHLVVALFTALARDHEVEGREIGMFALGGFGRGELSPHSDLDLLVQHSEDEGLMTPFVEGLLYPLWDARLDVQCVARTLEENLAVARSDARSRTSLLEARFLAGDPRVAQTYEREILNREILGRDVRAFVEAKLAEMEARHDRYGHTVYLLEPNVKEGEGGLRDIQTALWVAKVRFKVQTAGELLHKGVVPQGEIEALQEAKDFLLRVRNHLHFLAGRREDRLTFEYQDESAPFFGFEADGHIPGVERFLQTFYACANRVGHFTRSVIARATAGLIPRDTSARLPPREVVRGVRLRQGEIYLTPAFVRKHPLTLLATFEIAQSHDVELSPQALEVVRENLDLVDDRFRRDPAAVEMFLRILRHPRRVATTLIRMHDVRFLDRFIPEFGRIFGRVQRDLYHVYPVDVHSLFTVQELRRLARGEYREEFPALTDLVQELERPDILYLAALLHDVGKGDGARHDEKGAQIALVVGDRMGLEPRDLEYLVFLVANHLLLSHTAQGRDLHDDDLIFSIAHKVGDLEVLKMLYLLTVADIRAVGPGAWTSWKNLLLRELYEKTKHALESGMPPRGLAEERVGEVGDRLREAAGDVPALDVEAFLTEADDPQYFLANPLEGLLRHLVAFSRREQEPVVEFRPVPAEGYTEVLLVTRDRPGLFAQVAGLMAAHRLNILSAVLNTRKDGWVVDVFHVCAPAGEPTVEPERWERWRRDLVAVLRGKKDLESVVAPRLRRRPGFRRPQPRVRTRIHVDNAASRRFTVVDLQTADRLGLLYDVSRTFAEQDLTIRLAKIVTNIDQVADSFYVQAVGGGKLTEPADIARLEEALQRVIATQGTVEVDG